MVDGSPGRVAATGPGDRRSRRLFEFASGRSRVPSRPFVESLEQRALLAGVTVTPPAGLTTTEAGGTATFTVVLDTQPTADVTIALSSSDTSEGTIGVASLTFTPANWVTPQAVTVTGVDDLIDDGDVMYSIVTAAAVSGTPATMASTPPTCR